MSSNIIKVLGSNLKEKQYKDTCVFFPLIRNKFCFKIRMCKVWINSMHKLTLVTLHRVQVIIWFQYHVLRKCNPECCCCWWWWWLIFYFIKGLSFNFLMPKWKASRSFDCWLPHVPKEINFQSKIDCGELHLIKKLYNINTHLTSGQCCYLQWSKNTSSVLYFLLRGTVQIWKMNLQENKSAS